MKRLQKSFFKRNPLLVAPDLLGKILVRAVNGISVTGRIVEVEAYLAAEDEASHSYRGQTKRNASLFQDAGTAYVHRIHTQHCLDIVTEGVNIPTGVLIRALEPQDGIAFMKQQRGKESLVDLTSGPGKLSQALLITKDLDGTDMTQFDSPLYVLDDNYSPGIIETSRRIGITKAIDKNYRFYIKDSEYLSRK